MKKKIFITLITAFIAFTGFAQQIPLNSCGIVCTYDAAGNRLKRVYFCNNGVNPYPTKAKPDKTKITEDFQPVDALYPNPTTGKFSVTFSKALDKAIIHILDESGKIISRVKAKGYKVDFDLSARAAGVYYVRIEENGNIITKKIVKQ
jgi:hypothetical protein